MERWKQGNFNLWIIQIQTGEIAIHELILWQSLLQSLHYACHFYFFIYNLSLSYWARPLGLCFTNQVFKIGNNLNVLLSRIAVSTGCLFQIIKSHIHDRVCYALQLDELNLKKIKSQQREETRVSYRRRAMFL